MKLGLGTVQFGTDYGISNTDGKTTQSNVGKILKIAAERGIETLDTAPYYGEAEVALGSAHIQGFKVVTKTKKVNEVADNAKPSALVRQVFLQSLDRLQAKSTYGLLVHDPADLCGKHADEIWSELTLLKKSGRVQKIGVSIYEGSEIDAILKRFSIDLIQLPVNVFDQRLIESGHLKKLKDAGVEIHVRSAFLQGVLVMPPTGLPSHFDSVRTHLDGYHSYLQSRGFSPVQAALGFLKGISEIDVVLVGVNNDSQFEQLISAWGATSDYSELHRFQLKNREILNPSFWPKTK